MKKTSQLLLGTVLALILCGLLITSVGAQQGMPADPTVDGMATQPVPTASAATALPGNMPMGSGMSAMGTTSGMSGMSAPCAMMGQMGSGMTTSGGMTGAGMTQGNTMTGRSLSGSNMSGMNMAIGSTTGMTTNGSLYDADGRFVFWNLSPWWLLGWGLLALLGLAILASGVFGIVTIVGRTRRPDLVSTPNNSTIG